MRHRILWRTLGLLFVAVMGSGRIASQRTASDTVVSKLRTIAVVAVESPPIFVHPATDADRQALSAAGLDPPANGSAPWLLKLDLLLLGPGMLIGGAIDVGSLAYSSTPRTGEILVPTHAEPSRWMPTVQLAERAARSLNEAGHRKALASDGYVQLPVADRSANASLESWLAVGRRWYNSDESMLAPEVQAGLTGDAILEIGVLSYEYFADRLMLQVMVKLIDPHTNRVVARAREFSAHKAQSVSVMMQNQGTPMRELVDSTGQALLTECLQRIGLVP